MTRFPALTFFVLELQKLGPKANNGQFCGRHLLMKIKTEHERKRKSLFLKESGQIIEIVGS
jgi:hypothetical protein